MAKYAPGAISLPVLPSDPIETPDVGKLFFYIVGGSVKYKTSDGNIFVLATGVSPEEVQDIIGAFISGTNGVSAVYNDASNTLVLSVNKTEIINDLGTGATDILSAQKIIELITLAVSGKENTGVAASLLSAHESALDPHPQYTTTAELASALSGKENTIAPTTSADYYRGDKTFANFLNAVLAVVLTGYAVGANAALAATDTILAAFGKIQGQINQINSILLAQILGDQFEEFSDLTTATTTGATNIVAATFTTLQKPLGKYRIGINFLWANSSNTVDGIFDVFLDGVLIETFREELSETLNQRIGKHFFFYSTFAAVQTHVIELRMRQETAGATLSCFTCRAEIWRVN